MYGVSSIALIARAVMGLQAGRCDELKGIDLKKEYELIKQKKSCLSSSLRRKVVQRMEK